MYFNIIEEEVDVSRTLIQTYFQKYNMNRLIISVDFRHYRSHCVDKREFISFNITLKDTSVLIKNYEGAFLVKSNDQKQNYTEELSFLNGCFEEMNTIYTSPHKPSLDLFTYVARNDLLVLMESIAESSFTIGRQSIVKSFKQLFDIG